jgi:hypothetical protein
MMGLARWPRPPRGVLPPVDVHCSIPDRAAGSPCVADPAVGWTGLDRSPRWKTPGRLCRRSTIIPGCPISACEAAADDQSAVRAMTDIAATHPLDARAVAPAEHVLLLENEHVRVLDARVAPGARTPVHAHEWPGVLYVISTSDFVRYDPEGNVLLDSRTLPRRMSPTARIDSSVVRLRSSVRIASAGTPRRRRPAMVGSRSESIPGS